MYVDWFSIGNVYLIISVNDNFYSIYEKVRLDSVGNVYWFFDFLWFWDMLWVLYLIYGVFGIV